MDKQTKKLKAAKAKQEESALNRVLYWIVGGSFLEFLLLLLNRYYTHYTVDQIALRAALGTAVKVIAVVGLAAALVSLHWLKNARESGKNVNIPGIAAFFLAGASISGFAAWLFGSSGLKMMYLCVPAVTVLAFIYYLYQREFFVVAGLCGIGMLGIWVCNRALGGAYSIAGYGYLILAAVVLVGGAMTCRKLQAENGVMEVRGAERRVFPKNTNYLMLYITAILVLAVLIATVLSVPSMILMGVMVAWLLIMAVYYTVKMM